MCFVMANATIQPTHSDVGIERRHCDAGGRIKLFLSVLLGSRRSLIDLEVCPLVTDQSAHPLIEVAPVGRFLAILCVTS